jgi:pyridoxal/pyridoxine/pyridoxamine kinase
MCTFVNLISSGNRACVSALRRIGLAVMANLAVILVNRRVHHAETCRVCPQIFSHLLLQSTLIDLSFRIYDVCILSIRTIVDL